jgi:N-acetylglutamate synthase-like GNAT family acetyltransferase
MNPEVSIRRAEARDAEGLCTVLVRSVREICAPDYDHDEELLTLWCSNKTPDNLRRWIADLEGYFVVAEDAAKQLVGAGLIKRSGHLHICYVVPEVLHQGVGKALLRDMVAFARSVGVTKIELGSTITAKDFYARHGFVVVEAQLEKTATNRVPQFKMELALV